MSKKTQIHEILIKYENQVWDSFPSIYTKDDIKKMISQTIDKVNESNCTHYDLYKLKKLSLGL